jgi:RNA polymerase sigma-70 factor (ECF subfamily)
VSRTPTDPLRGLLDAALEGDDASVAELVRRTQADIWRCCEALGSRGEVEDLVQETYLRALGSIRRYRGDAPVRVWLLAVARNVCADHVRRRQRSRRLVERLRPLADDAATPLEAGPFPPGDLDDLLAGIDPDRRDAFVLTQILGLSYDEAAVALGCPIGTIRSRVARARADLAAAVRQADAV